MISEQKVLLEKCSTRKVFRRMETDSASSFVHRNATSLIGRWTDNLSKLFAFFSFNREFFISKIYERALRGSVKETLRRKQVDSRAVRRSQAIDRGLEEDSRKLRRECKILLLGSYGDCGRSEIVKQLKIIHQNWSMEEMASYRFAIYQNVIDCAKALIRAMEQLEIHPQQEPNRAYCDFLLAYSIDPDPKRPLGTKVGEAISAIWQDPCIPKVLECSSEFYTMESARYFFNEVKRITSPNYVPQVADVLRARIKTTGIYETRFTMGQLDIHLFDVGVHISNRRKLIYCFENVNSIIFVVNLAWYDQVLFEDSFQSRILESIAYFDGIVNSRWFMDSTVILFFTNVTEFTRKLEQSPLANYFPDYSGGNDVNRAAKYIVSRFNQVNRTHLHIYPHLVEIADTENMQLAFSAIKETILQACLRDSGII